ncbi:MAG: hypothetical protein K6F99_03645 [Lachnospiraceae bacterium]|nr:hypothetical protein [Lachnospiraceae bacterium]
MAERRSRSKNQTASRQGRASVYGSGNEARQRARERSRRKRRNRARLIRLLLLLGGVLLILLIIFGIKKLAGAVGDGGFSLPSKQTDASDISGNSIYFKNNGSITEVIVEDFGDEYDKDGLAEMVNSEIDDFDSGEEGNTVKLDKLDVSDGKAKLEITYDNDKAYAAFNSKTMHFGKIADLVEDKVEFTTTVTGVKDSSVYSTDEIQEIKGTAIILNDDTTVITPKKIKYYSRTVTLVDDKTASVRADANDAVIIY